MAINQFLSARIMCRIGCKTIQVLRKNLNKESNRSTVLIQSTVNLDCLHDKNQVRWLGLGQTILKSIRSTVFIKSTINLDCLHNENMYVQKDNRIMFEAKLS